MDVFAFVVSILGVVLVVLVEVWPWTGTPCGGMNPAAFVDIVFNSSLK